MFKIVTLATLVMLAGCGGLGSKLGELRDAGDYSQEFAPEADRAVGSDMAITACPPGYSAVDESINIGIDSRFGHRDGDVGSAATVRGTRNHQCK
jgi:hypothetical protein